MDAIIHQGEIILFRESNYHFPVKSTLEREDYLMRDLIKDRIKQLYQFIKQRGLDEINYRINLDLEKFYHPTIVETSADGKIIVPGKEFFYSLADQRLCLLPGEVKAGYYRSYTLSEIIFYLDQAKNYRILNPFSLKEINLTELKINLINYWKYIIKAAINENVDSFARSYFQLHYEKTILEEKIEDGAELDRRLFPLSNFEEYYFPLYLNRDLEMKEGLILSPQLLRQEKSENYTQMIKIDLRALTLNYAYSIEGNEYLDYVGQPSWIISSVRLKYKLGWYGEKV